jgi:hypothetical protein
VPPHHDQVLDYEGFLRWLDVAVKQETLPCARASTFPAVQYPDSHASERWYHLELARTSLVQACSEVVRRYHHDVADRITVPQAARSLRYAADEADDAEQVLAVHGQAMLRLAPALYRATLSAAATACFMAGRRLAGLRYAARAWRRMPASWPLYVVVVLGMLHGRLVAEMQALRARMVRARETG